ncbi:ADGRL3 [Branchiostoma lanceolatum]|uniref:ADGRL3 protein n=1 Tax=Branchiostoma lanceolatum TaxID=7740 RepID=A0A8J9ZPB4_BRALA|nr:ADGRL3 [Branchiostoma lanceolatum]
MMLSGPCSSFSTVGLVSSCANGKMFVKSGFAAVFVAVTVALSHSGTSLACEGPVTSFSGKQTIRDDLGIDGALLRDQDTSPYNADKVWYLPTYTGNTIEEYRTMDDFAAGKVLTTYRLSGSTGSGGMAWWGQGHIVYNNALYFQRFPDCLSYSYDCSNEKAQIVRYDFSLRAFTALQALPTAQLSHWAAGPSYVYLAVDAGSVWAIGLNNGIFQLTKLNSQDLSVEEIIDTEFADPSSNMPPFISCGKFYSTPTVDFKPPPDDKCVCNVNCGDDSALKSGLDQLRIAVHQLAEKMDRSAEPTQRDEVLHTTTVSNFSTRLQPSTTVSMTTTITPSQVETILDTKNVLCQMLAIFGSLVPAARCSRRTNHALKLQTIACKTNYYRLSFFPRTIQEWNELEPSVAEAESLSQFKTELGRASLH